MSSSESQRARGGSVRSWQMIRVEVGPVVVVRNPDAAGGPWFVSGGGLKGRIGLTDDEASGLVALWAAALDQSGGA